MAATGTGIGASTVCEVVLGPVGVGDGPTQPAGTITDLGDHQRVVARHCGIQSRSIVCSTTRFSPIWVHRGRAIPDNLADRTGAAERRMSDVDCGAQFVVGSDALPEHPGGDV